MKSIGMVWLLPVFVISSYSAFDNARAVEMKAAAPAKAPAGPVQQQKPATGPAQKMPNAAKVAQVQVTSVNPAAIQLLAGQSVAVTVNGSNLDKVTRVEVFQGGQVSSDIQPQLGTASSSSRQITLKATAAAKLGTYQLRVIAGEQRIDVPVSAGKIELKGIDAIAILAPTGGKALDRSQPVQVVFDLKKASAGSSSSANVATVEITLWRNPPSMGILSAPTGIAPACSPSGGAYLPPCPPGAVQIATLASVPVKQGNNVVMVTLPANTGSTPVGVLTYFINVKDTAGTPESHSLPFTILEPAK